MASYTNCHVFSLLMFSIVSAGKTEALVEIKLFMSSYSQKHLNISRAVKRLTREYGHGKNGRPQVDVQGGAREADEPSELNDMLPKQKHTFVILFPWSAFWLMFCQVHALGSLHSNCQRHKAGGSGGWRMSDVTEGWMKKRLSMFGMCWGASKLGKKKISSHAFSAFNVLFLIFSVWDVNAVAFF